MEEESLESQDEDLVQPRVIILTERDSIAFAEALLNPGEPNEALRAAFERYKHNVEDLTSEEEEQGLLWIRPEGFD